MDDTTRARLHAELIEALHEHHTFPQRPTGVVTPPAECQP